ncbi:unnamed protein product [Lactuca virosa]|uniref:Uncharacterized protein n=1 Tax=Lactuca virosa TaxID=75947 RepID=A0AAU9PEA2_9ASTR|nr:unnamed protein product [Lactuca virosa]
MTKEGDELKDQMDDIENKAKTLTMVSILEARLKMVEDVQKNRVDSWDKTKLEQALKKFKGGEHVSEKVGEENVEDQDVEGSKKGDDMAS